MGVMFPPAFSRAVWPGLFCIYILVLFLVDSPLVLLGVNIGHFYQFPSHLDVRRKGDRSRQRRQRATMWVHSKTEHEPQPAA